MSGIPGPRPSSPKANPRRRQRRGTILILAVFMMIVMMGVLALSIDVGYIMNTQTELKRATDAAALAGAGGLLEGQEAAQLHALDFLLRNPVGSQFMVEEENREALLQAWLLEHPEEFDAKVGHWDPDTRSFTETDQLPSTIHVTASRNNVPLFFGRIFGRDNFDCAAESVARYQPRDIALVLDFSGSMNDDSELKRIHEYGEEVRDTVEDNLLEIYQDLGSPTYGNMEFEPDYITLEGQAGGGCVPHVTVKFMENEKLVYVTSTKDLSNVVVEYDGGSHEKTEGLSGYTGTFGDGSRTITKVWVKSGCNDSGEGPGYGERFELEWTNWNSVVEQCLDLDSVPYPYSSGSWDSFIDYVQGSYYIREAGYKKKYGYMTLINYWLEQKPRHSQTSDLWKVSAQPVTAVKDATGVFMDYIQEVDCEDRVALVVYNSYSQNALVEEILTENFATIENIVQHRQAAHYDNYTNIGAGIHEAWIELDCRARTGSKKMIVLMTDGQANRPSGWSDAYALQEAQIAADKQYPIVTISLGNNADTSLMQQIADMTEGVHFNVPGNQSVTDYEDQLLAVFRQIADDRPLVLVK